MIYNHTIFLLQIQIGYIVTKTIERSHVCVNSPEDYTRDERDSYTFSADTKERDADDVTNVFFYPLNEDDKENPNELASYSSALPEKLSLIDNGIDISHNEKGKIANEPTTNNKVPLQETVFYKAIDPKNLIIYGPFKPQYDKNKTYINNDAIDIKETKDIFDGFTLEDSNFTKDNDTIHSGDAIKSMEKGTDTENTGTDISNIGELRKDLLDHLLEYFLNIIQEENSIQNDTGKSDKDGMKMEMKLSNYYDPHHFDSLFIDDDDKHGNSDDNFNNDSDEDMLVDFEPNLEGNKEYYVNYPNENTTETYNSEGPPQDLTLDLEDGHLPDGVTLDTEPSRVAPNTNSGETENFLKNTLVNTTEKFYDDLNNGLNITTTESSILNASSLVLVVVTSSELLKRPSLFNNSDEVTDGDEYIIDENTHIADYYGDYIEPDEFKVMKNDMAAAINTNEGNPVDIITDDGRRTQNGLDKIESGNNTLINKTVFSLATNYASNSTSDNEYDVLEIEINPVDTLIHSNTIENDANSTCNDNSHLIVDNNPLLRILVQNGKEKYKEKKNATNLINIIVRVYSN